MDISRAQIRAEQNGSKVGGNFAEKKEVGILLVPNCFSSMLQQEAE